MMSLLKETLQYVVGTLIHNAPVLVFGIMVAAAVTVYVDPEKMKSKLLKNSSASIGGSVAFGAFTPFCACGTMAVIIAMMTTSLPWAPVMAFLTSSPLMSPDEFILYSGIVSFKFAVVLTIASILVGLGSGYITHLIEKKTSYLNGQARFADYDQAENFPMLSCCSSSPSIVELKPLAGLSAVSSLSSPKINLIEKYKLAALFKVFYKVGIQQVLVYFAVFAAIGFLINKFVPASLIMQYMGSGNHFAVPFMALVGLPLYVSGSSAIPIINALLAGGASHGALLAFMITGPGTSAGVIAGLVTIMRKKAIALYVLYLLVFAIVLGYLYDYLLLLGI